MKKPNISAMTFDGEYWSGWSNSGDKQNVLSISDAVQKIKKNPELGFRIIDADNLKIWVSDISFAERAIMSAKTNFGVDIPAQNVFIGFPAERPEKPKHTNEKILDHNFEDLKQ